jgi:cysteine synthase
MNGTLETASDALARPRLVRLGGNLIAVCFEVMKLVPAKYIIEKSLSEGLIDQDTLIVESSSGNLAMGLAIVCREKQLRLHIVGDPAIDPSLQKMLHNLGATVEFVEKPDARGAFQRLRLERVQNALRRNPNAFWVRQYDNPLNLESYREVGRMLHSEIGPSFELVAAVGSGGSSVGIGRALRGLNADITLTGVDTFNSVLFGLPDGKRTLRGLGNSIMPKILDHTQFDAIHWVTSELSNRAALDLHAHHGLFCGPTSGSAYLVAQHVAQLNNKRPTVFIAPDTGYRYQQSVYACDWQGLRSNASSVFPIMPMTIDNLEQVQPAWQWNCMVWGRRTLTRVMNSAQRTVEEVV